jgi:hypothetical protein
VNREQLAVGAAAWSSSFLEIIGVRVADMETADLFWGLRPSQLGEIRVTRDEISGTMVIYVWIIWTAKKILLPLCQCSEFERILTFFLNHYLIQKNRVRIRIPIKIQILFLRKNLFVKIESIREQNHSFIAGKKISCQCP